MKGVWKFAAWCWRPDTWAYARVQIIKWKHLAGLSGGIEKTIDKNNLRDLGRSKQSLSILHNLYRRCAFALSCAERA